ncbi:hypothetical protein WOLCODRAFT_73084 [Wolfiporia cocos MD-104 SS10]|uniref:Uncharacterized protein n=1 Tax=Wolfiporia cocos (strain MD-104) TaxID=742152 RepID=A0A2H3JXU7_WOLCO|nr:hypothetical protein WOLCODRAFT_73084 [Wolfiporia cocos MD-104 SS10]
MILNNKTLKPYPTRPSAAGLPLHLHVQEPWRPAWKVFPLKVFRGSNHTLLKVEADWDDEMLLRELNKKYDDLRTIWRKRSLTMVMLFALQADHSVVFPKRVGPGKVSPTKNMRLRWLLHHPGYMKGRHEFMQVLTARADMGIEFVERWQLLRIVIAITPPVMLSVVVGVVYSILAKDPGTGFTIAGYMTSAYSVCLVLVGVLNLFDS